MKRIINILLLPLFLLVLTSLLLTCTSTHKDHQEVVSKDGHRVVVVEYDKESDGTTKVSISPPDDSDTEKQPHGMFSGPRDLVCDAYGKCKHKVASALEKTKDVVKEVKEHTKEVLNEAVENSPREAKNKASEKAKKGVASKAKKVFGNVVSVVKDGWSKDFDVIDSPKRIAEDISRNVTGALGKMHRKAESVKEQAKQTVKNAHEKLGDKSLSDILYKFKEAAFDVVWYALFHDKIGSLVSLVHMLGFSTAYGMCVWVTFVSSYVLGRYLPRQMLGVVQSRIYPVYFRAMACCVSAALLGHLLGQKTGSLGSKIGLFQTLSLVSALLMVLINMIWLEPKATKAMYRRMKLEKEEGRGVAAKDGMADRDGVTVAGSMVNGKGGRVADGGGDTVVRSVANVRGVRVAVKDNGMANGDGVADGSDATVVARRVVVNRQDVLKLNERLKKLNAYSSALNMFTLVALTWHMAYMGQRLQAK